MLFILKPYKLIFDVIEKRKSLWCMAYYDGISHSVIERRISALNPQKSPRVMSLFLETVQ